MENKIVIICAPMHFYSYKDEDAFFEWLYAIKSITKIEGIGRELYVDIDPLMLSNEEVKDFFGFFKRYKLKNKTQLKKLVCVNG